MKNKQVRTRNNDLQIHRKKIKHINEHNVATQTTPFLPELPFEEIRDVVDEGVVLLPLHDPRVVWVVLSEEPAGSQQRRKKQGNPAT